MDRRAIGGCLLALAFGPVALGAIALGAATQLDPATSATLTQPESAQLAAFDLPADDSARVDARSAGPQVDLAAGPGPLPDPDERATAAAAIARAATDAASRHILSLAPKTSPPV